MNRRKKVRHSVLLAFLLCHCYWSRLTEGNGSVPEEDEPFRPINILTFIPCNVVNASASVRLEDVPIFKMAVNEVNADIALTNGTLQNLSKERYRLVLHARNSQCHPNDTLLNFYKSVVMDTSTVYHMILGPACSDAATVVGSLTSQHFNMTQLSYSASSISFLNRTLYGRFYSMNPTVREYNKAFIALFKRFKWKRVAIVYAIDPYFVETANHLRDEITNDSTLNIDVLTEGYSEDPSLVLSLLKENDMRIIVAFISSRQAPRFWLEVYNRDMYGERYVWFTVAWNTFNLEYFTQEEINNIKIALNNSFGILGNDVLVPDNEDEVLLSGKTVTAYKENVKSLGGNDNFHCVAQLKNGYIYDSIWALAKALDDSIPILKSRNLSLDDYSNSIEITNESLEIADVLNDSLSSISFNGVSGLVSFIGGFNKNSSLEILQFNSGVDVQYFSQAFEERAIYYQGRIVGDENIYFTNGKAPLDGPEEVNLNYNLTATLVLIIISILNIVMFTGFIILTFLFRKLKSFSTSSSNMNILMCFGMALASIGSLVYGVFLLNTFQHITDQTEVKIWLMSTYWFFHIGLMITFGSIVAKTWRMYRILYNPTLVKRKRLSDRYLLIYIGFSVLFVAIFLLTWSIVSPEEMTREVEYTSEDVKSVYYVEEGGQWWWVWLLILGVWYFLNALFGLFMIAQIHISTPRFYRDALHDITTPALASIPAAILVPAFILLQRSHYGTNILVIAPVAALLRDLIWLWPIFLATYVHKFKCLISEWCCSKPDSFIIPKIDVEEPVSDYNRQSGSGNMAAHHSAKHSGRKLSPLSTHRKSNTSSTGVSEERASSNHLHVIHDHHRS